MRSHAPLSSVLVIAPGEVFGGAERQIITFARWARRHGISYRAILFNESRLWRELRDMGLDVDVAGGPAFAAIAGIKNIIEVFRPSGIHVHGYRAAVLTALGVGAKTFNVVSTQHGLAEAGPAHRDRVKIRIYHELEFLAHRRLQSQLVFVTEDLRKRVSVSNKLGKTHVIYNGIEANLIPARSETRVFAPGKRNLLIAGRLEKVKGIDIAIRSLSDTSMPDDVVLHILGDGDDRERLERVAHSHGLDSDVQFHGFRKDVYAYIAQADVMLIPSLHEGLPYTLLEAMVLRIPVIASNVGGLGEVLTHDKDAILVPPNTVNALAAAIIRIFGDPSLRNSLTSNAADLVDKKLSADKMCRLYYKLLSGRHAESPLIGNGDKI